MEATESVLLEIRDVVKRYSGVTALNGVDLTAFKGEVLAVIGENGAGKSTLMKILAGVSRFDEGTIRLDGKPVMIDSVQRALGHGIALIHQELSLADNLDVGSNIFLGREPTRFGVIDSKRITRESKKYLDMVGLKVSPSTLVSDLTIGLQQLVEIAKALSVDARILIMDEPTSSLSQTESEALFKVIRRLKENGVTVIYISHRLGEIQELADRVSVLRDGENAGELQREEITHDSMVRLMVGRDVSQFYERMPTTPGNIVLEVNGLRTSTWPAETLGFSVRSGEIVGIAGLVGAGRTELLETLFGIAPATAGTVSINGRCLDLRNNRNVIDAGAALVPEDRKSQGLILETGIRENIGLPGLGRHKLAGAFVNRSRQAEDAKQMISEMKIKTPSDRQIVQYLSGGNQQKVVIGKWLSMNPKLLLLDEPTRGVDVGAKQEIYRLMEEQAAKGVAVLFVSSEMEEVLSLSDRVLVMHEGCITGELTKDQLSEEAVMQLATSHSTQG